ncbi:MAG: replicative DNA helicase [Clostridia bacterium]|nr:replicative DNA helicase [Clostridia bacterium]
MPNQSIKMMPHSTEAEQSVLGCMLIDSDVVIKITAILRPTDFYLEAHKVIYENMCALSSQNQPIDYVTVVDKLEKANSLDSVGGIDYITSLANALPSAINFMSYVNIVKRDSLCRSLISVSQKIAEKAYMGEDGEGALSYAEGLIYDLAEKEQSTDLEHISSALTMAVGNMDEIAKNGGKLKGIATGITEFDMLTNGLQNSDLILLAARPGVGKTSFAMNIAINAALEQKKTCAIFSLEMPRVQLAQRSICSVAKVSMSKAKLGKLSKDDWKYIWIANKKLSEANIFIDDSSMNRPTDILDKCRRLKREKGLDIVVIDYLQLMTAVSKADNRQQEISEITRYLKIAAKELNVPIILLSQLSRAIEQRKDHKPMLSDLRESGAIEQDADIVLFIDNPDKYNDIVNPNEPGICELVVAKHRNGELANIKMRWIGEYTTFVDPDKKIGRKDYGDDIKVVSDDAFGGVPEMPDDNDLNGLDFDEIANAFDDKDF